MPQLQCVVLAPKGTTRNAALPVELTSIPTAANAGTILRRATPPETIGTWTRAGNVTLHLFGYKSGKAGTENKHELPPPHDSVLLFGEALIVATQSGKPVTFTSKDFTTWYTEANNGFESLGDDDSDTEDDEGESEDDASDVESTASDSSEPSEGGPDAEEEEEDVPVRPPPKILKTKRANKKLPAWFSIPELMPEPYEI
jgi:hypothetical protein